MVSCVFAADTYLTQSSPAPGQQPLKRPKLRGSPRVDSDMPGDPHDVVIDVLMVREFQTALRSTSNRWVFSTQTISPREADQPEANQVRRESPYLATSEQQHQVCHAQCSFVLNIMLVELCSRPAAPFTT